jgi:AcrR family transcriptional regulator
MTETGNPISSVDKRSAGPGRPRSFDEGAALDAAMRVFWERGFEATSLDDLTKAMGLSKSSFYAAFGCKQTLFLRAVDHYSRRAIRTLKEVAETAEGDSMDAMMQALANPEGGSKGCLLINCITELAPHDEKVAEIGRRHIENIEEIFAKTLDPGSPDAARDKASAYYSLAIGTLALRKAGIPPERIARTLQQARSVLST